MVARLGAIELRPLANHRSMRRRASIARKTLDYVRGREAAFWWERITLDLMVRNAGFFPPDPSLLERFSELMLEDMPLVDILGSSVRDEALFTHELRNATTVR